MHVAAAPKQFREVGKWTVSPCIAIALCLLQAMQVTVEPAASVAGCGRFLVAEMGAQARGLACRSEASPSLEPEHQLCQARV